jgi:hypothetical protein
MELHRKDLIGKKKIAIIEPNAKEKNDRTFCFWLSPSELNEFEIAHLVSHEWEKVVCNDLPAQAMETYRYYYIRAESLYTHAKSILEHYDCLWQRKEFDDISDQCSGLTFDYDSASHLIGNVKFKDTATLDFSLMPASPGIGAGIEGTIARFQSRHNADHNLPEECLSRWLATHYLKHIKVHQAITS